MTAYTFKLQTLEISRRILQFLPVIPLLFMSPPSLAQDAPANTLDIGVVPYISARALVGNYEPLRNYLEQTLNKPTKIFTSANFRTFFISAQKGDYDMVITSANFARILQKNYHYTPMLRYATGGGCLLLSAKDKPLHSIEDIRGRRIASPDRLSMASISCLTYLRDKGIRAGSDFTVLEMPSFASAILSLQKDDAAMAISAPGALAQMPEDLRDSVRTMVSTREFVSLVLLAHPRLGARNIENLRRAIIKFGTNTSEGKQFLEHTGFGNFVPVTTEEMNSLDHFADETQRLLGEEEH